MLVFDFDLCALNDFYIGKSLSVKNETETLKNIDLGYNIYIEREIISGIFICLNSGYRGYKEYEGKFIKNKKTLRISNQSKPDDILYLFGLPVEQWDDGSEINMQFLIREEYRVEFSLGIQESEIKLDYIIIELGKN